MPIFFIVLLLLCAAGWAAPAALNTYNVVWDSPSTDSTGSMPIGNGDIGMNLWVEKGGDLCLYLSKTDAWDGDVALQGNVTLRKLGQVRVHLEPNPFVEGQPFQQVLQLHEGEIAITAGQVQLHAWVDANHPVVRIEVESPQPVTLSARAEMPWRKGDTFLPAAGDRVVWYMRNTTSQWAGNLKQQGMAAYIAQGNDPLLNRTFGVLMRGDGLTNNGDATLTTVTPRTHTVLSLHALTAQTATPAAWVAQLAQQAAHSDAASLKAARTAHRQWWADFWARSWIDIPSQPEISRNYALQRFRFACAGRGAYPIKFNGNIFTMQRPLTGIKVFDSGFNAAAPPDPDFRAWGGYYWFQNTRLLYWPMLAAGDYDLMRPLFAMYRDMLPFATARTRTYYGHDGAFFPETQSFWGTLRPTDYDRGDHAGKGPDYVSNSYIRYYWQGELELTVMMLDYYAHTRDDAFLRDTLLPLAESIVAFYDQHYPRDAAGRIHFTPAQSLETWHEADNPLPEIAGLRVVLDGLLQLPGMGAAQRTAWTRLRGELPLLPTTVVQGKTVLAPAVTFSKEANTENPELYAIFPYRIYGVGKPDLDLAKATFAARKFPKNFCWGQDNIQLAYLGMAKEAAELARNRFTAKTFGRFPTIWNSSFDWIPDEDHGGSAMVGLQAMLLQADGNAITLFPAWPKDWDVTFKLHAPQRTVVEGVYRHGTLERLVVTPPERRKDVTVLTPK
ncbi:MAG TPA: DUF5703 domain-containing protein [Armatimonadota bacterium]|jgi:hypothetical protein